MNAAPPMLRTTPRALADWILSTETDGFTLSGGDPFDQPLDALAELLEIVRSESPLGAMVYTGRTLSQLQRLTDPDARRCLRAIDILVDGPYVEELNDGLGWRGSSNQMIHVTGPRSTGAEAGAIATRRLELRVAPGGLVSFTGLPARKRGCDIGSRIEFAAGHRNDGESRNEGEVR
jgi:anaerobic ribonucleoside-triphosphate reductase activating protein